MQYLVPSRYNYMCRYSPYRRILTNDNTIVNESVNKFDIETNQYSDYYHIITQDEIGRLDVVAARYYGDPKLWWIIAYANNITDAFNQVTLNKFIIIPPIDSLYNIGSLYNQEELNYTDTDTSLEQVK